MRQKVPWFQKYKTEPLRKAKLRSSGGESTELTKETVFELMGKYNPDWKNENVPTMFPVMPKPAYEGPLGMDGTEKSEDDGHKSNVTGFRNETKVIERLAELARTHNKGLKVFHGVHVSLQKLETLCSIFGKEMPDEDFWISSKDVLKELFNHQDEEKKPKMERELVDILVVTKSSVLLLEVKSRQQEMNAATEQLKKAEFIFSILLRILNVSIPITKVFYDGTNYILPHEELPKIVWKDAAPDIVSDDFELILASLGFLCCTYRTQGEDLELDENELGEKISEPHAARALAENLKRQSPLEQSKSSKVKKLTVQSPDGKSDQYFWLDPIQSAVMECNSKKVFIAGPAGTGKTILLQLKIEQILKNDLDSRILVFFPPWPSSGALAGIYTNFLKQLCTDEMLERVRLITLDSIQSESTVSLGLKWEPTHTFIEEFKAFQSNKDVSTSGLKMLADFALKSDTFVWITLDVLQGFGSDNPADLEPDWLKFINGNFTLLLRYFFFIIFIS